jgi:hypothetical protein
VLSFECSCESFIKSFEPGSGDLSGEELRLDGRRGNVVFFLPLVESINKECEIRINFSRKKSKQSLINKNTKKIKPI